MKKIAIVQSNYIPWKGYFDLIAAVDEFILYDDAQYTRRDWRNRNQIKTPQGLEWLTVPVRNKNKYTQKIRDTEIAGTGWDGLTLQVTDAELSASTIFQRRRPTVGAYLSAGDLQSTFGLEFAPN